MEGKHELSITNHFVKVMMPGFHQKLNLPPIVSKEVEARKSRSVILESRIGKWKVSLCRNNENGLICLKQGWPKFVERHALTIGEFVFFKLTDDLHFNVSVFGTNMSEKEFPNEEKEEEEEEEEDEDEDEEEEEEEGIEALIPHKQSTMEEEEGMLFEKTMEPHHASKLVSVNIPFEFLKSNNLGMQHMKVVLRDPRNNRKWELKVNANRGVRFRMKGGWHAFYVSNALKDGDRCVFRLNRSLLTSTTLGFDVQIIRAK